MEKQDDEARLADVVRQNGEEHLFDNIMALAGHADEEPPVIFGWEKMREFVEAIAAAGADPMPDPPFTIPQPLTSQSFKEAQLNYARVGRAYPRFQT
uniref:Uncharacterized protein n=1 Tax=Globisporangium ultimum (strain ATCC 200006 / CBS 805.95 / DAOM BR144) TaxID=431595 RepID=K3WMR7_GLOUD